MISNKKTHGFGGALVALGFLWFTAAEAEAQIGFAAEGRVAVTVPTGDLSDAGAETGIGFGAELQANFTPAMTAYVGLYRHGFGCEDDCGPGGTPRSTGVNAGLKYIFHNPGDVLVWGRGGIVANTYGNDDNSSDRKIGFEVGVGADMPVADRLYLVPHLGYISHGTDGDFTINFFTFGVGLHYHIR